MIFQNPGFLWALLALAIPIAIHLFNFRRTKKILFSNVAFLKKVDSQTSAFRKLKQWLVLLSRCLALASLVLAFAQPFLPSATGEGLSRGMTNVYIDNSLSMQNTLDNKSLLDWTVSKIDELLMGFPVNANLLLTTNDFETDDHNIGTVDRIRNTLTTIKLSTATKSLEQVLKRQQSMLQRNGSLSGNQLFVFSDFQKSTLGNLQKIDLDSSNKVFLVPVVSGPSHNVFVDSTWLGSPFIREMQNNTVFVKVKNSGTDPVEKLGIKLTIDQNQASGAAINIPASGSAVAALNFTVAKKGYHKGQISFDDQPVNFDNDYFFVLNASPSIEVLHLYQSKAVGDYVSKVFENDSLFNFKSRPALSADIGQFKTANLIILEGVDALSGSLINGINAFVAAGGSVAVFPSANPNEQAYQGFLASFGVNNLKKNGLPATAGAQQQIEEITRANPFFADVFETIGSKTAVTTPRQQPVWQFSGALQPLIVFKNGQAMLSQAKLPNGGKLYVSASPLDEAFGNYVKHGYFLPTLYKMAAYSLPVQRLAYGFNEEMIKLSVRPALKNDLFKLKKDKVEIIPTQRLEASTLRLEMPKATQADLAAGFYELMLNGQPQQVLAFNHNSKESDLATYSTENLKEIFAPYKNVKVFENIKNGDFATTFKRANFGTPLWKYFIVAALAFLLAEGLIIRFLKNKT
jgi:hypothetical protein